MEDDEAVPRLLESLRTSDDAGVRNAAALKLSDMAVPELLDVVTVLLTDPRTVRSRGTLLYALGTGDYDCRPILGLLVDLALTGGWEVSRAAAGLVSQMEGEIDATEFDRARQRLLAADAEARRAREHRPAASADPERHAEVIQPLLELFAE